MTKYGFKEKLSGRTKTRNWLQERQGLGKLSRYILNFKNEDKNSNERLIAHHNRLSPVRARDNDVGGPTSITFDESDIDSEGNLPLTSEEETNDEYMQAPAIERAYPKRIRK